MASVARSIELYRLGLELQERRANGDVALAFTKEPALRAREEIQRLVVANGSFDPLSVAHVALFEKGLEIAKKEGSSGLDEIVIATTTSHWNKPVDVTRNAALYDRFHALEGFASCQGNVVLTLFNDPLYLNLTKMLEAQYGPDTEMYFVLGADVMRKIVDPAGYESREVSVDDVLDVVFKHHFIVSEREIEVDGVKRLVTADDIIKEYGLQEHASQIIGVDIEGDYENLELPIESVSSSLIRTRRASRLDVRSLEAAGISDFVDRRGIYLQDSTLYAALVAARERFSNEHSGEPIKSFIGPLMDYAERLYADSALRDEEIARYVVHSSSSQCVD